MRVFLLLAVLLAVQGSRISQLKQTITSKSTADAELMAKLGSFGPFKVLNRDIIAKVSKRGQKYDLPISRQRGAWNPVEGNAMIEAWSVGENGLIIKNKDTTTPCNSAKGRDNKDNVAIAFTCMLEGGALLHEPGWPIKTGYDSLSDQTPLHSAKYDEKDDSTSWDPRVRFWHRCAGGEHNGLSLCNRYRFIGADAQGYYGCDNLTQDGYCIQSYRHEWMEYNPDDLPFVFNPETPCAKKPCLQKD